MTSITFFLQAILKWVKITHIICLINCLLFVQSGTKHLQILMLHTCFAAELFVSIFLPFKSGIVVAISSFK